MRRSDIAVLILIVSITLVISFFAVKGIFGEPENQAIAVEKVEEISPEVSEPSPAVFNSNAINPTVVIQIGNPANQQPFSGQ